MDNSMVHYNSYPKTSDHAFRIEACLIELYMYSTIVYSGLKSRKGVFILTLLKKGKERKEDFHRRQTIINITINMVYVPLAKVLVFSLHPFMPWLLLTANDKIIQDPYLSDIIFSKTKYKINIHRVSNIVAISITYFIVLYYYYYIILKISPLQPVRNSIIEQ